jgi:hypothetical protein
MAVTGYLTYLANIIVLVRLVGGTVELLLHADRSQHATFALGFGQGVKRNSARPRQR